MKRTILASVTVGLAALMTFGCGNVVGTITGNENNSNQPIAGPPGGPGQVYRIYAVDAVGNLLSFLSDNPLVLIDQPALPTGLPAGEKLVAIDFRPSTGILYGVTNNGKVFYIDKTTFQCFQVGPGVPLAQVAADIDFNPVVDRMRQIAATQNIRVNPNTGVLTAADTNLNIGGVPNSGSGVGTAYTNNFFGTTTTQLFTVDSVAQRIFLQDPPNTGALTLGVPFPFFIGNSVGFDFAPNNLGYLALTPSGATTSKLFTFDPASGTLLPQPDIAGGQIIKSIAVQIDPPPVTNFVGIDEANNLVRFNSLAPQTLISSVPITGIAAADVIRSCDFRPADNSFNVLTVAAGGATKLFTVNLTTGVANLLSSPGAVTDADSATGIDFNPVLDVLRVVNGVGVTPVDPPVALTQNGRFTPPGGPSVNDGFLTYPAGDPGFNADPTIGPLVPAAAYTQNFAGSKATRLFVVDTNRDKLCLVSTPNNGVLTTLGNLSGLQITEKCGLDIEAADQAWMVCQLSVPLSTQSILCRINLTNGQATPVSQVGGGLLKDFAAVPTTTP